MPSFWVTSAGVRSPEPAAPIQCTSGQAGCALAIPAERPTAAAPATAAAQVNVAKRRNITPQPFSAPTRGYAIYIAPGVSGVTPTAAEIDEMAQFTRTSAPRCPFGRKRVGSDTEQGQEKRRRRRRQTNRRRRRKLRQPDRRRLRQTNLRHPDGEL